MIHIFATTLTVTSLAGAILTLAGVMYSLQDDNLGDTEYLVGILMSIPALVVSILSLVALLVIRLTT